MDESTLPPADKSADGIGVVDLKQNKLVKKIDAGSDPEEFALSRDGKTIYASNEDISGLSLVDLASGKLVSHIAGWRGAGRRNPQPGRQIRLCDL